jgi:hypothetical protein
VQLFETKIHLLCGQCHQLKIYQKYKIKMSKST